MDEAVRRHVVVNLEYQDLKGIRTDRAVEAHGFYEGTDGWCLIGWCHLRNAGRIFQLGSIRKASITKKSNECQGAWHLDIT